MKIINNAITIEYMLTIMKSLFILIVLFASCEPVPEQKTVPPYSKDQKAIHDIMDSYITKISHSPNNLQQNLFQDSIEMQVSKYMKDTAKMIIKDCLVKIDDVNARPFGNIYALTVDMSDESLKYWMEIDYNTDKKMKSDTLYKIASSLKEGEKQKLNLRYINFDKDALDRYRVQVVLVP